MATDTRVNFYVQRRTSVNRKTGVQHWRTEAGYEFRMEAESAAAYFRREYRAPARVVPAKKVSGE